MDKLAMQTANVVDENIKRIGEMFSNCLTERLDAQGRPEVAIDFDQLRQELSKDIVEGPEEHMSFVSCFSWLNSLKDEVDDDTKFAGSNLGTLKKAHEYVLAYGKSLYHVFH